MRMSTTTILTQPLGPSQIVSHAMLQHPRGLQAALANNHFSQFEIYRAARLIGRDLQQVLQRNGLMNEELSHALTALSSSMSDDHLSALADVFVRMPPDTSRALLDTVPRKTLSGEADRKLRLLLSTADRLEREANGGPPIIRQKITGARFIAEQLRLAGVEVVFGQVGGPIIPVLDALIDTPEIRYVSVRHENEALFAANAYARMTGKLGVAIVTSGPGILNSMTGIAAAFTDSLPILVLAGETSTETFGKGAPQDGSTHGLNILDQMASITKERLMLHDPDQFGIQLHHGIEAAQSGRKGPVVLTLPSDILRGPVRDTQTVKRITVEPTKDVSRIASVGRMLSEARAPLIIAGSGVRWGGGPEALLRFVEKTGFRVVTTMKGKGVFPESHPLHLGNFGYGYNSSSREALRSADVVLAIGTTLNESAIDDASDLLASKTIVQIDIDQRAFENRFHIEHAILGSVEEVLDEMGKFITPRIRSRRDRGIVYDPTIRYDTSTPTMADALRALQRMLPENTRYVLDVGDAMMYAAHHLVINDPQGFLIAMGLGPMGSSLPMGLGAALASPGTPIAVVMGDGAFAATSSTLGTVSAHDIPLIVAVMNNGQYSMTNHGTELAGYRIMANALETQDVASIATAYGAAVYSIKKRAQLAELVVSGLPFDRLTLLDIHVDPKPFMPLRARMRALTDAP